MFDVYNCHSRICVHKFQVISVGFKVLSRYNFVFIIHEVPKLFFTSSWHTYCYITVIRWALISSLPSRSRACYQLPKIKLQVANIRYWAWKLRAERNYRLLTLTYRLRPHYSKIKWRAPFEFYWRTTRMNCTIVRVHYIFIW